MITGEQYKEIVSLCEEYAKKYNGIFPDKPMSEEYIAGFTAVIDLIKTLVKK